MHFFCMYCYNNALRNAHKGVEMAFNEKQIKKLIKDVEGESGIGRIIGFIIIVGVLILAPVMIVPALTIFLIAS